MDYAILILRAYSFHPHKIDASGFVRMHDLIRDTGRETVRQGSTLELGKRSRIWYHEDIVHVLEENKMFELLSIISFEDCRFLTDLPSLREVPLLTDLCLDKCTNLVKIGDSIEFLYKLRSLSAEECIKLKILAPCIMLTSLEILDLQCCSSLESFPEVLGKIETTREIYLDKTAIEKLPFSIENFVGLQLLSLKQCASLIQLPGSICILPKVEANFGYGHKKYGIFEEMMSSEVSPMAMVLVMDIKKCLQWQ